MTNPDSSITTSDAFPEAAGVRVDWFAVPQPVRAWVAEQLGAQVASADTQRGGFTPGVAARLTLTDGRRVFVKAVSSHPNPETPGFHRREAEVVRQLPAAVAAPRLLFAGDVDDWTVLCFENVEGHQPDVPWDAADLARVADALVELSRALTPAPFAAPTIVEVLGDEFSGFRRMAAEHGRGELDLDGLDPWLVANLDRLAGIEAGWVEAAAGDSLLHCDVRADNVLLTEDRVVFVDWPHVATGAAWIDLLALLPSASMQGGPPPWEVFDASPLARGVDPRAVDAFLCGLTGYFLFQGHQPPPPGIPTVRAFQLGQGEHGLRWLRHRLGSHRP